MGGVEGWGRWLPAFCTTYEISPSTYSLIQIFGRDLFARTKIQVARWRLLPANLHLDGARHNFIRDLGPIEHPFQLAQSRDARTRASLHRKCEGCGIPI